MDVQSESQRQNRATFGASWKIRRNSKSSLLDLGPPLRVPVCAAESKNCEACVDDQLLMEGSTPASTFPVYKSSLSHRHHAGKTSLTSSQPLGVESHTGTRMNHGENGMLPQPHEHKGGRTTHKIPMTSSFPNLASQHPPSVHCPAPHPSHPPIPPPPPSHPHLSHPPIPPPPPSHPHMSHPPPIHPPIAPPPPSHPHLSHPPPSHPPIAPPPPPHPPKPHSPSPRPTSSVPSFSFFRPPRDEDIVVMSSLNEERKFRRLGLLGRGGSSKVYRVISEDAEIFALKEVYLKDVDSAVKHAYITEIKFLKRLKGLPEVITLHDFSWDKKKSILYLLLEYAETDLAAVIKKSDPSIPTALYFWNEMLRALAVIHNEGIIHNDLKPENFVFMHGRLKLIDFGIANRIEDEFTSIERDLCCGTMNYMSPESIETYKDKDFFKVGRPSDVWSLGCILYQMLYGHTPFNSYKKKVQKIQAIINPSVTVPFPATIGNSAALDVMKKCLNRNPKERPTVQELLSHPFTLYQTQ